MTLEVSSFLYKMHLLDNYAFIDKRIHLSRRLHLCHSCLQSVLVTLQFQTKGIFNFFDVLLTLTVDPGSDLHSSNARREMLQNLVGFYFFQIKIT